MQERFPCGESMGTYNLSLGEDGADIQNVLRNSDEIKWSENMSENKVNSIRDNRVVLCGANAYEKKYYFNEQFTGIPDSIKDELHIICVLFTEEVGGVFTIVFEEDGTLSMVTDADENDFYYDEISSGLLVNEIRRTRQELFESLRLYYRVFILKEDVSALLEGEV